VQDVSPPHASLSQPSKRRSVERVNPPAEPKGHAALRFAEEEEGGGPFLSLHYRLVPLSFPKCFLLVLLKEMYLKESYVSAIPIPRHKPHVLLLLPSIPRLEDSLCPLTKPF